MYWFNLRDLHKPFGKEKFMINILLFCGKTICRILSIVCISTQIIKTNSLNGIWLFVGIGFITIGEILGYFLTKKEHKNWH